MAVREEVGHSFDNLRVEVEQLANAFAGAYAMKTDVGLRPVIEAWVECRNSASLESVVGILRHQSARDAGDQTKTLKALTDVDFAFRTSVYWRAVLRDIGLATAEPSDDAFLFAARSIEGCARQAFGRAMLDAIKASRSTSPRAAALFQQGLDEKHEREQAEARGRRGEEKATKAELDALRKDLGGDAA